VRVALFPGHVGKDTGAIDRADKTMGDNLHTVEATVADCITRKVARYLCDAGVDYIYAPGNFRSRIMATAGCDLGVSIHADWCGAYDVHGYHTIFYPAADEKGKKLALCIDACMNVTAQRARAPHARDDLYILRKTNFPVCLVEVGFLSNIEEESALYQEDIQYRLAMGIVYGVLRYIYNGSCSYG
jgi:N-acetylmuramoyl-L-alanine amidase